MTMRNEHLAPDYAAEAVKLNPLGQILHNAKKETTKIVAK